MLDSVAEIQHGHEQAPSPVEQRFVAFARAQENIRTSVLQQRPSDIVRGDTTYIAGLHEIVLAGVDTSSRIKDAIKQGVDDYVSQEKKVSMWEQQWGREHSREGDEAARQSIAAELLRIANRGDALTLSAEQRAKIKVDRTHGGFSIIAPPDVLAQIGGISCDTAQGGVDDQALVAEVIAQSSQFGFALSKSETASIPGGPDGGIDLIFVSDASENISQIISHEEEELFGMRIEVGLNIRGHRAEASRVLSDMAARFEHPGQEGLLGASGVTADYAREHPREVAVLSLLHKRAEELIAQAPEQDQVRMRIAQELRGAFLRPEQLLRVWYGEENVQSRLRQETMRVQQPDFKQKLYGQNLDELIITSPRDIRFMYYGPPAPTIASRDKALLAKINRQPAVPVDELERFGGEIKDFGQRVDAMQGRITTDLTNATASASAVSARAKDMCAEVDGWRPHVLEQVGRVEDWELYLTADTMQRIVVHIDEDDRSAALLTPWAQTVGQLHPVSDTFVSASSPLAALAGAPLPRPNISVTKGEILDQAHAFLRVALRDYPDNSGLQVLLRPLLFPDDMLSTGVLEKGNAALEEPDQKRLRAEIMTYLAHRSEQLDDGILTAFKDARHRYLGDEYLQAVVAGLPPAEAMKKVREFMGVALPGKPSSTEKAYWQYKGTAAIGEVARKVAPPATLDLAVLQAWGEQLQDVQPAGVEVTTDLAFSQFTNLMTTMRGQTGFLDSQDKFNAGMGVLQDLMSSDFFDGQMGVLRSRALAEVVGYMEAGVERGYPIDTYVGLLDGDAAALISFMQFARDSVKRDSIRPYIGLIVNAVEGAVLNPSTPGAALQGARTMRHMTKTLVDGGAALNGPYFASWEHVLAAIKQAKGIGMQRSGKVTKTDIEREADAFLEAAQKYLMIHPGEASVVDAMASLIESPVFEDDKTGVGSKSRERALKAVLKAIRGENVPVTEHMLGVMGRVLVGSKDKSVATREYLDAMQSMRRDENQEESIYRLEKIRDRLHGSDRASFVSEARRRGYMLTR